MSRSSILRNFVAQYTIVDHILPKFQKKKRNWLKSNCQTHEEENTTVFLDIYYSRAFMRESYHNRVSQQRACLPASCQPPSTHLVYGGAQEISASTAKSTLLRMRQSSSPIPATRYPTCSLESSSSAE